MLYSVSDGNQARFVSGIGVALGYGAGYNSQRTRAIAIGELAGKCNQGTGAIAIGFQAGILNQHSNTIILNASGSSLDSITINSFYVNPIRGTGSTAGLYPLYYNTGTHEILYYNDGSGGF